MLLVLQVVNITVKNNELNDSGALKFHFGNESSKSEGIMTFVDLH